MNMTQEKKRTMSFDRGVYRSLNGEPNLQTRLGRNAVNLLELEKKKTWYDLTPYQVLQKKLRTSPAPLCEETNSKLFDMRRSSADPIEYHGTQPHDWAS